MLQLTREVNACIDGVHAADPQADIYVIDRHGGEASSRRAGPQSILRTLGRCPA